ncbi:MAG: TerB family tellurite resistance protein [Kofleriaceae bacterium]
MNFKLDAKDLSAMNPAQQASIIDALFLMIAIDRKIEPREVEEYNATIKRIPFSLDAKTLDMVLERARLRMKATSDRIAWQYWVKEIAETITQPPIREKLLGTMCQVAIHTGTVEASERELLNGFAGAFEIPLDKLSAIRAEIVNEAIALKK